jgi:transitional endoplasmic reticulum ATPase
LRNKPLDREVNAQDLGTRTEGCSGADISAVCHQAALRAIRRAVHAGVGEDAVGRDPKVSIEAADLEAALQSIRR